MSQGNNKNEQKKEALEAISARQILRFAQNDNDYVLFQWVEAIDFAPLGDSSLADARSE